MSNTSYFDALLTAVEEMGLLHCQRRLAPSELEHVHGVAGIEGEAIVEGCRATVQLVFDSSFPTALPSVYLHPWDSLGLLPHVLADGYVCYAPAEGIVLDRHRPLQIVADAVERAVRVLADGIAGRNHADFLDEFEVYWNRLDGPDAILSFLEPDDELGWVMHLRKSDEGSGVLVRGEADFADFNNGSGLGAGYTMRRALYVPLDAGSRLTPPRHDRPFWSAAEARRALLPGISAANREALRKLTRRRIRGVELVIVRIHRPSGGASLVGIRYEGVGETHPLLDDGTAERLVPIRLVRLDRSYVIPRGGGDAGLATRRVLLVGAGAVGGYLAFELARAGALDLTVVDFDTLRVENVFRHVLGNRYIGKRKAEGLKAELEAQLPYVRVRAVTSTIERAVNAGTIDLTNYDLVVVATGNPSAELKLNAHLRDLPGAPPAVFTWLEPHGIGGHALLAGNGQAGGCFECLYTPVEDGADAMANRAAFAAPGQWFARALDGCGSLHLPYGSADAAQTAVLAARLAIDALTGTEQGNPLRSWKGSPAAFRAAGFRLSPRYAASEQELHDARYWHANPRCAVCQGGASNRSVA